MRNMLRTILATVMLISCSTLSATDTLAIDTLNVRKIFYPDITDQYYICDDSTVTPSAMDRLNRSSYGPVDGIEQETENGFLKCLDELFSWNSKKNNGLQVLSFIKILFIAVLSVGVILLLLYVFKHNIKNTENSSKEKTAIDENESLRNRNNWISKEIEEAYKKGDYTLATSLIYRYAVRLLSLKKIILENESKTPSEYTNEIKDASIRRKFILLSKAFLSVRYGDSVPDAKNVENMIEICNHLLETQQNSNKR